MKSLGSILKKFDKVVNELDRAVVERERWITMNTERIDSLVSANDKLHADANRAEKIASNLRKILEV